MSTFRFGIERFVLIAAAALLAALLGGCGHAPTVADLPSVAQPVVLPAVQPDIQVLILRNQAGPDLVDITYPEVVPSVQAHKDVDSIAQAASLTHGDLDISNSPLKLAGVKPIPMTSATFAASENVPDGATTFRLEPWILALRGYRNLAITYLMPPQFVFNGLRSYQDRNVQIALAQNGQSYTYHVHVLDSTFQRLNLPLMQPDPRAVEYAEAQQRRETDARMIGLVLVSIVAAAAGYGVYTFLSRMH